MFQYHYKYIMFKRHYEYIMFQYQYEYILCYAHIMSLQVK